MLRKKISGFILLLTISGGFASAQEWTVPEEESARENPLEYNLESVQKGKELYLLNCKSCHGDPGKNNALPLVPAPPDVISDQMHANSEGDLFYKITEGRGTMPPFKSSLSEDDRWHLVNFNMNYHPDRVAVLIEKPPVIAMLVATMNEDSAAISIYAEYKAEDGSMKVLKNTQILIGAKRAFGSLPIGEVTTDEQGRGEFTVPATTIGDEEGLVDVFISLGEDFEAQVVLLENAAMGTPKDVDTHIRQGVLWSTNDNMPYWLVFSFALMVLGAWGTIGYVVLQIVKIKKQSKEDQVQ